MASLQNENMPTQAKPQSGHQSLCSVVALNNDDENGWLGH